MVEGSDASHGKEALELAAGDSIDAVPCLSSVLTQRIFLSKVHSMYKEPIHRVNTPRVFVLLYRQDGRSGVFHAAEREIAKMLAENLLSKFKATPEYKEVAGDLLFEAK